MIYTWFIFDHLIHGTVKEEDRSSRKRYCVEQQMPIKHEK